MTIPTSSPIRQASALQVQVVTGLIILGLFALTGYAALALFYDDAGTFHMSAKVADLDDDGDLDVVLHRVRREQEFTAFGGATLWINQGHGAFRMGELAHEGGWATAPGDFDGDGDVDLLLYIGYQLRLLVNQRGAKGVQDGEFSRDEAVGPRTPAQFGSLLAGDLDGDGKPEGVVLGCCGRLFTLGDDDDSPNYSQVWRYTGDADSASGQTTPLAALNGLTIGAGALGDLDGDADLDLFAGIMAPPQGRNTDPADRVLFNDGAGSFADSGQRLGQTDSSAVALGDLEGDGDLDALVGHDGGAVVWLNQGGAQGGAAGTFIAAARTMAGGPVTALFLSDFDGDVDLDALTAGRHTATIWWNDGQGAFSRSGQDFRLTKRHALAVGDFDGDGLPDILAANHTDDVRLWLNQGQGAFLRAN